MNNIYFMCENCGIETNGITFVNGMKFCAKCYHQIFGKDNQQTEITQLKQQLVEKEKELAYMTKQAKKFNHEAQKYYEDAYCNSFQNQKAIAELEKVKMMTEWKFNSIVDVVEYIDNRIKELKGE